MKGGRCTAYIVQESKGSPLSLCVIDHDNAGFHVFDLSMPNAARLVAECGAAINEHLGGLNPKWGHQDLAAVWASKNDAPSDA